MSTILLDIRNIHKTYVTKTKTIHALKGVNLTLYKGEIVSLLGVNGAGKTTLSSIIATLHPANEGDILHNGHSIYTNLIDFRSAIGFCPQQSNVDNDITVEENLLFAGRYYGMTSGACYERAQELLVHFDLEKYATVLPRTLSGGYRQRLMIARALMHKPQLVILDEPTVGLDPHIRRHLWDTILSLKKLGMTVLITTHYLDEAEVLSDRIVILDQGVIKLIDTPQAVLASYNKKSLEDVFLHLMEEQS